MIPPPIWNSAFAFCAARRSHWSGVATRLQTNRCRAASVRLRRAPWPRGPLVRCSAPMVTGARLFVQGNLCFLYRLCLGDLTNYAQGGLAAMGTPPTGLGGSGRKFVGVLGGSSGVFHDCSGALHWFLLCTAVFQLHSLALLWQCSGFSSHCFALL